MAPQRKDDDDEFEYPETSTEQDSRTPTAKPFAGKLIPMASSTATGAAAEVTSFENLWTKYPKYPPFTGPPPWASSGDYPWLVSSSSSKWITTTKETALGDGVKTSQVTTSPFLVPTNDASSPLNTSNGYGKGHPDWHGAKGKMNSGGMYAAAAITPILVLAVIGGFVFFFMRKRKRQRAEIAAAQKKVQEMKMHPRPQTTAHPYMAPPPAVSPPYTARGTHLMAPPNPSAPPPIILGPIPSGANGAYFTGIDTSDGISITSASNLRPGPPNPFSDNDSLAEPPPPYRPRSAAPPSLTNSSRHSSFRASAAPPATSRTHLIERSPFEDPVDDDTISDLSGPTAGRSEDAMSAVSDLSYQNDPVVNRSSL